MCQKYFPIEQNKYAGASRGGSLQTLTELKTPLLLSSSTSLSTTSSTTTRSAPWWPGRPEASTHSTSAHPARRIGKAFNKTLISSNGSVSGWALLLLPLLLRGASPPPRRTWRPARASTLSGAMQIFSGAVSTLLLFGWKVLWGSIIRIKCRQRLSGELGEGAWQSSCSSTTGSPRPRLHLRPRLQHLHLLHRGWLSGCLRNGSSYGWVRDSQRHHRSQGFNQAHCFQHQLPLLKSCSNPTSHPTNPQYFSDDLKFTFHLLQSNSVRMSYILQFKNSRL